MTYESLTFILGQLSASIFYGGFIGFVSLFELIKNYYKKRKHKYDFGELNKDLQNEEIYKLLEKYCRREFSFENIILWKEINKIINEGSITMENFEKILKKFILPYSSFEINIPSSNIFLILIFFFLN
jgi:predicted CopG family antitoxin